MENQSILSDQELKVDDVIYRELRSLNSVVIQDGPDSGKVERVLVHTRSIGNKSYTVKKIGFGSENCQIEEQLEENKMTSLEVWTFQEVWKENKMTSFDVSTFQEALRIGQQEAGGFKSFLKKLLKYE